MGTDKNVTCGGLSERIVQSSRKRPSRMCRLRTYSSHILRIFYSHRRKGVRGTVFSRPMNAQR